MVIPIAESFLYVVPLYLLAEGTNLPQLKRVIVAVDNRVVMEPTLDEALTALFRSPGARKPEPRKPQHRRHEAMGSWRKPGLS